MLNKIISFSLRNRPLILFFSVLLIVAGTWTAREMEVDVFPDLTAPTVVVMTEARGMAAEEVERLVTFPVETSVNGATGVRRVRSSSTSGFSVVWVEFDWGFDIFRARQIVSEKLTTVAGELPSGVSSPVIGPQSSIMGEVLFVGLTSDSLSAFELRNLADRTLRPHLLSLGGVAQVAVIGGGVREYQILVHPELLSQHRVTLADVISSVREMTLNVPGGTMEEFGNEYVVRGVLSTRNPEELKQAALSGAAPGVTLGDVAEVKVGAREPAMGCASVEGKPAVILTVTKQPGIDTRELTAKLDAAVEDLKRSVPASVTFHTRLYRQQDFIDASIGNIQKSLLEGGIFVVLVLFVFLMNPRTTFISLVTIPLSLLVTLLVLRLMGLTVNTMSVGGMAIAIGSLVDDAIVDVENVFKRLRQNARLPEASRRSRLEVVFEASKEVRMPVFNSTLIIIVSFIPLFFLGGMEGRMLAPLGISFIVSLFASTLIALTLTPVLSSYLLHPDRETREPRWVVALQQTYRRVLWRVLRLPKEGIWAMTVVLSLLTIVLGLSLGRSFLPPFNEGSFTINLSALPGTTLEETDRIGRRAEEILLQIPEVKHTARKTGRAELDEHALGVNVSELEVPFELSDRSKEELVADIRHRLEVFSGVNVEIGQPVSHRIDAMLSGTKAGVAIKIFGPELPRLHSLGLQVKNALSDIEGIADLNVEQQVERPQIDIRPRRTLLAARGITLPAFSEHVEASLGGLRVGSVQEDGFPSDLTLRFAGSGERSVEDIRRLPVSCPDGTTVPLSDVADVVLTSGPHSISRENARRKVVVSANVTADDVRQTVDAMKAAVAEKVKLPEGYQIEFGGQFESEARASALLSWLSAASVGIIFLLLFGQFRSWRHASIVMLGLPLALLGGVVTLLVTGQVLSIPALIGFVSLFGIATRGGMLLVERYRSLSAGRALTRRMVVEASADRLQPILMTALTSALALIPLALGGDLPGNEIQSPMACVILGGLLTGTLLNLILIPALFCPQPRRKPRHSLRLPFMKQSSLFFLLFFIPLSSLAQSTDLWHTIERESPTLRAARSKLQAGRAASDAEVRWDDPEAEVAHFAGSPKGTPARTNVNVSQSLDWGMLTGRRRKVAQAADSVAWGDYVLTRYDLHCQARRLMVEAVFLNRFCSELQNRVKTADGILQHATRRKALGEATSQEVSKARLQLLMAQTELKRQEAQRRDVMAQLSQLADGAEVCFRDTTYSLAALPALPAVEQAAAVHPAVLKAKREVALAESEHRLSKVLNRPTFSVGFAGEYTREVRYSGVSLGVTIPLWGRGRAESRSRRLAAEAVRTDMEATEIRLRRDVTRSWEEARSLWETAEELTAEQFRSEGVAKVRRAYEEGQLSLTDCLLEVTFYDSAVTAQLEAERDAQLAASDLAVLLSESSF